MLRCKKCYFVVARISDDICCTRLQSALESACIDRTYRCITTLIIVPSYIALAQAVFIADIFLMGELQKVAKGQEDAFTLHV